MKILDNVIGVNEASQITKLSAGTIKNYCAEGKIASKKIGKTWVIDKIKLEEMVSMKKVYEEVMNVFKENEKVFVNYYNNVNELLEDGMDEEVLNEDYFVWGSDQQASELNEPFIIVEVSGAVDTPIFTEEYKEKVIDYLEDNHKEYLNA